MGSGRLVSFAGAGKAGKAVPRPEQPTTEPRRITSRIGGLSVKRQQQLVQLVKQSEAAAAAPAVRQPRRPQPAPQLPSGGALVAAEVDRAARERELQRARKERELAEAASRRGARRAVLLVDAYNVLHAWPKYAARLGVEGELEGVRAAFVEELRGYASFRGTTTTLVFDSRVQTGNCPLRDAEREKARSGERPAPSAHLRHTRAQVSPQLATVFSCGADGTADAFIESEVVSLLGGSEAERPHVVVATSDRLVAAMCRGAGASVISADQLVQSVADTDREVAEDLRRHSSRVAAQGAQRVLRSVPQGTASKLLAMRLMLNEEAKAKHAG